MQGSFPSAFAEISTVIVGEASSDFAGFTSFIKAIPTLAPAILSDIEQGGEDVSSIFGELAMNPEAALTLFVNDTETVISEVWAELVTVAGAVETDAEILGGEINTFFGCLFGNCPASACATTDPAAFATSDPAALALSQSCANFLPSPTAAVTGTMPTGACSKNVGATLTPTVRGDGYGMVLLLWMLPLGVVSGVMLLL
jgi:hypothetical protein